MRLEPSVDLFYIKKGFGNEERMDVSKNDTNLRSEFGGIYRARSISVNIIS